MGDKPTRDKPRVGSIIRAEYPDQSALDYCPFGAAGAAGGIAAGAGATAGAAAGAFAGALAAGAAGAAGVAAAGFFERQFFMNAFRSSPFKP